MALLGNLGNTEKVERKHKSCARLSANYNSSVQCKLSTEINTACVLQKMLNKFQFPSADTLVQGNFNSRILL